MTSLQVLSIIELIGLLDEERKYELYRHIFDEAIVKNLYKVTFDDCTIVVYSKFSRNELWKEEKVREHLAWTDINDEIIDLFNYTAGYCICLLCDKDYDENDKPQCEHPDRVLKKDITEDLWKKIFLKLILKEILTIRKVK